MRNVSVRNGLRVVLTIFSSGIAVFVFTLKSQIQTHSHKACLNRGTRVQGHGGGVVVNAGNIGTVNTHTGISAAQSAGGLFGQHEAGCMSGGGGANCHHGGSSRLHRHLHD